MASHSYYQLDVFSHRPGGGNPLGVVVGADDWSDAAMQAFAKWTDIVETTFLLRPTAAEASYRLRIFMPDKEIAFAGHPSIGSAHVALLSGFAQARDGILIQECQAGLLPVRLEGEGDARRLFIQAPAARIVHTGIKVSCSAGSPASSAGGRRASLVAGRVRQRRRRARLATGPRRTQEDCPR